MSKVTSISTPSNFRDWEYGYPSLGIGIPIFDYGL